MPDKNSGKLCYHAIKRDIRLRPQIMKRAELQQALAAGNLSLNGTVPVLKERLTEALARADRSDVAHRDKSAVKLESHWRGHRLYVLLAQASCWSVMIKPKKWYANILLLMDVASVEKHTLCACRLLGVFVPQIRLQPRMLFTSVSVERMVGSTS